MMELIIEVSSKDADEILEWSNTPHSIFVTSSVPALHMWDIQSIRERTYPDE